MIAHSTARAPDDVPDSSLPMAIDTRPDRAGFQGAV